MISFEVLGLVITAVSAIMVLLGYSANRFSGTSFLNSLLPFAIGVLGLILATAGLLIGWWKLRKWLQGRAFLLPSILSICIALVMGWFSMQDQFALARGHFRTLVGGKQEAGRVTIAHQVYAAYRRYDPAQLQRLVDRAKEFNPVISEAAKEFDIDPNLLQGIAATESSFLPRDSVDGGRGLFQITQVPKVVVKQAGKHLAEQKLSLLNPRHNAFIAAATLKYYLAEMNDDLFLGLLAYNIGPANGGLRFIMQQYGATDFVTIQPYLQELATRLPYSRFILFPGFQALAKRRQTAPLRRRKKCPAYTADRDTRLANGFLVLCDADLPGCCLMFNQSVSSIFIISS